MSPGRLQGLQIPQSNVVITTKIIDLTTISGSSANNLYFPPIEGVEHLRPVPSLSFLLEHPSGQKLLFDLGVPKDITVLGPEVADRLKKVGHRIEVEKDVVEVLEENAIQRDEINAVIWRCVKDVVTVSFWSCSLASDCVLTVRGQPYPLGSQGRHCLVPCNDHFSPWT